MRRYLPSSAVNGPVWLGVYTKAMMINRLLTIFAAAAACAAGTSLADAQQGYPVPPGSVYSASPGPYVPGGYVPQGDRVTWSPGFWAREQPGWDWVPARWVRLSGGWTYREGHWERVGNEATPRATHFQPPSVTSRGSPCRPPTIA